MFKIQTLQWTDVRIIILESCFLNQDTYSRVTTINSTIINYNDKNNLKKGYIRTILE